MKRIAKDAEPAEFRDWKNKSRSSGIEPGWSEFDGTSMKQTVKLAILTEQGYLCCFCETRVETNSGHIAHLLDQNGHPHLVLDYNKGAFANWGQSDTLKPRNSEESHSGKHRRIGIGRGICWSVIENARVHRCFQCFSRPQMTNAPL